MFISIAKSGSRFGFYVGDDPRDDRGAWVSSLSDSAVLGDVPPTFPSFGSAHAAASRIAEERPSCVLAKKASFYSSPDYKNSKEVAEGDVVAHYIEQVEIVGQRLALLRHTNPEDLQSEVEVVENEINGMNEEVKKLTPLADGNGRLEFQSMQKRLEQFLSIVEQLKKKNTTAGLKHPVGSSLQKSVVRAFSEAAMLAIEPLHKNVFVKGAEFFPGDSSCESVLSTPEEDLVRLVFDKNMLLSGIKPCRKVLAECGGVSSNSFYLNYWEPIVNAVGHFYSKGHDVVAVCGLDPSQRGMIKSFGMSDNARSSLVVNRPLVCGKRTWMLSKQAETVTQPPETSIVVGDEVECVSNKLPTYFGRTGTVNEVSQKSDKTLYRVDFRRGIGPLWLEGVSVRKVVLGQ